MSSQKTRQIKVFDTTLCDGLQNINSHLTIQQKIQIAIILDKLGVDIIEISNPNLSVDDFLCVDEIVKHIKYALPCLTTYIDDESIDRAYSAIQKHKRFRLNLNLQYSLIEKTPKDNLLNRLDLAIKKALSYTDDIELSIENVFNIDFDYLKEIIQRAIKAKAQTINLTDSLGFAIPSEFSALIQNLYRDLDDLNTICLSVHCHNTLGFACANSLSAILDGVRQIECTLTGLGAQSTHCYLENIVLAIKKKSQSLNNAYTNINFDNLQRARFTISDVLNLQSLISKKHYVEDEIDNASFLDPLHMNARSGRHMVKSTLMKLGYDPNSYDLDYLYKQFLKLAEKKGQVTDYDLEALLFFSTENVELDNFELISLNVISGCNGLIPTATIKLRSGKRTRTDSGIGNGPIDAVFNCIMRLCDIKFKLCDYKVKAQGTGTNAQALVNICILYNEKEYYGRALSTDIVEGSAQALIKAINTIYKEKTKK